MKGYKGFSKGLICRDKQYAENTVFEEESAEICNSGMHFCKSPFGVLEYYGFVNDNAELNEFAEVEALDECKTDDKEKYCTKKIKIGAKLDVAGLVKAFVDFTFSKVDFKNATESNTGDWSASTNTGYRSASSVEGKGAVAMVTGYQSKAKANIGSAIVVCERDDNYNLIGIKAAIIDGKNLEADTYYMLKNGEFMEVGD